MPWAACSRGHMRRLGCVPPHSGVSSADAGETIGALPAKRGRRPFSPRALPTPRNAHAWAPLTRFFTPTYARTPDPGQNRRIRVHTGAVAARKPEKGPNTPDLARTAEGPVPSPAPAPAPAAPGPLDHLPVGTWRPVALEATADGDILALRLATADSHTALPDTWLWRRSPADQLISSPVVAAIKIYGLGPAFSTRAQPGHPTWELWRLDTGTPRPDADANDTVPITAAPTTPLPGPTADELAARRTRTGNRVHSRPRPSGPATGPYRSPRYVRRPPQMFYDQDEDPTP